MWKKFTVRIVASVLMLLTFIIIFNWLINPFDIFDSPKISHLNENKLKVSKYSRVYKAIVLKKTKPKIIFLGTSRTEYGMDPNNQNLNSATAYNSATASGFPVEYEYYADMAIKNGVNHIIIGTDFFAFYSKDLMRAGFDKEVFKDSIPVKYFLSLNACESSFKVIGNRKQMEYLETGQRSSSSLERDFNQNGSYKKSFQKNEKGYLTNAYQRDFCKIKSEHWRAFERILDKAHQHNVKVTLFISPSHARQWEVLDRAQGYGIFEEFKRKLVGINETIAYKNNKIPFALWDFSGYSILTTEVVPNDPNAKMKWYWDSSHYKKELGDVVLDRMFDGNFSGGQNYPDFGVKLTSENIEAHLAKLRIDRTRWQASHPIDIQEIQDLKK